MIGLIQEIGTIILKQLRNSNLLIVGYGSIGKKYRYSAAKFFKKGKKSIYFQSIKIIMILKNLRILII